MMTTDVYDQTNSKVGTVELPERVFGVAWKPALVHQVLQTQMANARQPLAHTKGRGEVRGGGKKPWRQKGTGRARHGSIRSPLWSGGGVTHGPVSEKVYARKINKKMRRVALFSVLTKKLNEGKIRVVTTLSLSEPKTKLAARVVRAIAGDRASALLIPQTKNVLLHRAVANLPKAKSVSPHSLNVYDLLRFKMILLDREAVAELDAHYTL